MKTSISKEEKIYIYSRVQEIWTLRVYANSESLVICKNKINYEFKGKKNNYFMGYFIKLINILINIFILIKEVGIDW